MKAYSLLLMIPFFLVATESSQQLGIEFAKQEGLKAFESFKTTSTDDLLPEEDKGKKFDSEKAWNQVLSSEIPPSSLDWINPKDISQHLSKEEGFLKEDQYQIEEGDIFEETCIEAANPIQFSIIRRCEVSSVSVPPPLKIKRCLNHKEKVYVKRGDGRKEAEYERSKLSHDSTIKHYYVTWEERGFFLDDVVIKYWTHKNDIDNCDCYTFDTIPSLSKITYEENWHYQDSKLSSLIDSPDCVLIAKECLDDRPRVIEGHKIQKCFVEKLEFQWMPPKSSGCQFLKSELCDLKSSRCIKDGPLGCALWERKFHCYRKLKKKNLNTSFDLTLSEDSWNKEYEPNQNFGDVATKLAVFQEMDLELKKNDVKAPSEFSFFKGVKHRCYIHELELGYDCCNQMGGFSNELKLSHCDADEIALQDLKNRGQCVYIGSDYEKVIGIKTSKKYVYCCFPSKLARVFQEKARKQLGISWGDVKKPNCQGLDKDLIAQIDMASLDLTEAFEEPKMDVTERLEKMAQKITSELGEIK